MIRKNLVKWAGLFLCLLGAVWFCLPLLRMAFTVGTVFGVAVCMLGAGLIGLGPGFAQKGRWQKITFRALTVCYLLGLLWAGVLTGRMLSVQLEAPPRDLPVIVLGAQIRPNGQPTASLTCRIDAAADYLLENPDTPCIVTGGQGDDEPRTEAEAMAEALVARGVGAERIYLETEARNTRQNMEFAAQLAREKGLGKEFVIVTQGYHLYRSIRLAKSAGLMPFGLAAETDPLLLPSYYGRELLSLTKWQLEQLFTP